MKVILKELRQRRRMSQKELETASGVHQSVISDIENGAMPMANTLYKLSCALRCTVDDLIEEDPDVNS